MPDIFSLSPKITLLPVLHGSGDFALEIRRRMLTDTYDCLAVPLPPAFEDQVEEGITHLPAITAPAAIQGTVGPRAMPGHTDKKRTVVTKIRRPPVLRLSQ